LGVPVGGIGAAGASAGAGAGSKVADFFYCPKAGDLGVIIKKEKSQLLASRI